jgi:L,D-transpeptidase ErfK/SrfK
MHVGSGWRSGGVAALALTVWFVATGSRWTEEDFARRVPVRNRFAPVGAAAPLTVVGELETYVIEEGDTLLDVGRHFDVGYNEIVAANPDVEAFLPPAGEVIVIPGEHILPDAGYEGVIVNIPEMRLYHYHGAVSRDAAGSAVVTTYPVGLGRDDWRTPEGRFKIRGKTENPTWVIPESIRAEHIRERNDPRTSIAGGDPENPLGVHRLELTLPLYALHGSNMPWGVGMQVSHGCIRLYNEDIAELFREVRVGTPGEFLYQPVKIGTRNGAILAEVHPDIYGLRPSPEADADAILVRYGWTERVDRQKLRRVIAEHTGMPTVISTDGPVDTLESERGPVLRDGAG